ncbi:unnamed protein product [Enterobius vermicularis]|uniref:Uncharacterized protein n=1 Tax=Enterobius vermicularis TaxID=51028 RepID=A0A0N4V551_ENTVE|nr:unnamed protein product [Enterobius vermicularis]
MSTAKVTRATTVHQSTRKPRTSTRLTKVTLPTKIRRITTTTATLAITPEKTTPHTLQTPSVTESGVGAITSITSTVAPPPSRLICKHRSNDKHEKEYGEKRRAKLSNWNKMRIWRKLSPTKIVSPMDEDVSPAWKYWPNAELFAAIKDVVNKFRASIDQSGLQQDVRHMGTQLQNTWDQLRRGLNRSWDTIRQSAELSVQPHSGPVNEQLGRLFERAQQVVADAVTEEGPHRYFRRG